MRDQQRSVDCKLCSHLSACVSLIRLDLDCFLDISQHLALCRLYVRELRRSVLVSTPDNVNYNTSVARHSQVLSDRDVHTEMGNFNDHDDTGVSPFLRSNNAEGRSEKDTESDGDGNSLYSGNFDHRENRNSYLAERTSNPHGESPNHTINRRDIRASAERILYAYLIQGAEREITLPPHITRGIATAIEVDGRDDPEVFDEARDYIFQAMEREAFPGFLRSKALGNLVPMSAMTRLIIGLMALFGGFWTAFALIFLNYSRATRIWVLLPFLVGTYCCFAHQYELDPILAMLGISESTFFNFVHIKEPYVKSLLFKRSLWVLFISILTAGLLTVVFSCVPSTRI